VTRTTRTSGNPHSAGPIPGAAREARREFDVEAERKSRFRPIRSETCSYSCPKIFKIDILRHCASGGFCDPTEGRTFTLSFEGLFDSELNQTALARVGDGFGPADDVEFGENAFHVRLHRALTNEKCRANFLVAFALRHQLEHIDFAVA
jgi:hypothetical protein